MNAAQTFQNILKLLTYEIIQVKLDFFVLYIFCPIHYL